MLTELSASQWEQVKTSRSKYLAAGRVCGSVDRSAAELAVKAVYAERGLVPPSLVIWARSPSEGCVFAGVLESLQKGVGSQVFDQFRDQLWNLLGGELWFRGKLFDQFFNQLGDQLRGQLSGELSRKLGNQLGDQIKDQIGDQIKDQIGGQLKDKLRDELRDELLDELLEELSGQLGEELSNKLYGQLGAELYDQLIRQICTNMKDQLHKACYGPHDLYWLGFYQFLKVELGLKSKADPGPQISLAKNCGWWWPFKGAVVLTEHPVSMQLDEEGRLHSETDMAIKYSDGFGLYSWRGVQVPSDWILKPSSITASMALTWENIEQRRVAAEIVGWDKVLSELGAKEIDVDGDPQIGVLLEVTLPDSGLERFLRVECGTGRTFALPVPPEMKTALEAQCWMHGDVDPSIIRQLEVRT